MRGIYKYKRSVCIQKTCFRIIHLTGCWKDLEIRHIVGAIAIPGNPYRVPVRDSSGLYPPVEREIPFEAI
jgi:hypothetical protein